MTIKKDSNVTVHYKLSVDGQEIESSFGKEPFSFTSGSNQIIAGFDSNLQGLNPGDKTTFELPPTQAYGEKLDDAVQELPKSAFQDAKDIKVGSVVQVKSEDQEMHATVVNETDEDFTLDFNHPLAGKTLKFEVEVLEVK